MMKSIKGFTLVELIITIALVAIIGVIAGLNLYAYTLNRNLKSAARAITSDFSFCKGKAISENTRYQIAFDVAGKSYTIQPGTPAAVTKNLSEFGSDIEIESASFGKGHTINFYTRGTAAPGNIKLKNSRQSRATIKVNITGRTHVAFDME